MVTGISGNDSGRQTLTTWLAGKLHRHGIVLEHAEDRIHLVDVYGRRLATTGGDRLVVHHRVLGEFEIWPSDAAYYGEDGQGVLLLSMYALCGLRVLRDEASAWVVGTAALDLPEDPVREFDRPTMMLLEDVGNPPAIEAHVRGLETGIAVTDIAPLVPPAAERADEAVQRALRRALVGWGFSLEEVASAGSAWLLEREGLRRGFVEVVRCDVNSFCAPFTVHAYGQPGRAITSLVYGGPARRFFVKRSMYETITATIERLERTAPFESTEFRYASQPAM